MNPNRSADCKVAVVQAIDEFRAKEPDLSIMEVVKALEDLSSDLIDALLRRGGAVDPPKDHPYSER
jgi:DNA-binding transcriptional LysR family regulator